MSKRFIQFVAVVGISLLVVTFPDKADAGRFGHRLGMRGGLADTRLFQELNLSDEQRADIQSIRDRYNDQRMDLLQKAQTAGAQLRQAMSAESVVETDIRSAHSEWASVMADMAVMRANMRTEIQAVLTPEQRDQLKSRIGQFMEKRKARRNFREPLPDDGPQ